MRIGVVYPQIEFPTDAQSVAEYARTAEGLGFTHILAYDHVLGANPERPGGWQGPYTFQHPFMEPLTTFSYMAAITERIEFTTGVIVLPQRQTALVAKQAAILDVLSGGRLRLGIGIGWNAVEYEGLKESFRNRGKRVEEQLELLQLLWTQELVTYTGKWHRLSDTGINPLPIQRPIPIWLGGHHENVLKRVARFGAGWMPNYRYPQQAATSIAKINRYMQEAGRDPQELGIEARIYYGGGEPGVWMETLAAWKEAGATHASFNTMGAGFKTAKEHLTAIEVFAKLAL